MKDTILIIIIFIIAHLTTSYSQNYLIIDTGQDKCYNDSLEITPPLPGETFYGQDAQFNNTTFSFQDNGDGTITDLNTGLMWQKTPSTTKFIWADALTYCNNLELAGHDDWRAPSIKELWSIQDFQTGWPYINMNYFDLIGPPADKDQQFWSSNLYLVSSSPLAGTVAFGVNHGTGHIKAYPIAGGGPMAQKWVRAVRGNTYGINDFANNGDGTITDNATGLMWMQDDNGEGVNWKNALSYAENLNFAGHEDWRLPNAKELQSIVDYSGTYPTIDTNYFNYTADSAYFWSNTSAYFGLQNPNRYYAWYVAFGYAVDPFGEDIHGAGAVRFDTKVEGGPAGEEPERVYNFVRLVRGGLVSDVNESETSLPDNFKLEQNYPNPFNPSTTISFSIPVGGNVSLKIFNAVGQEVDVLVSENLSAGNYSFKWNAKDRASGIYLFRLTTDTFSETKKMILNK